MGLRGERHQAVEIARMPRLRSVLSPGLRDRVLAV
jgi:hypothetical protein